MKLPRFGVASAAPTIRRWMAPLVAVLLLGLAACNGTAVVTLTATASPETFLTYRVGLVSVQLQTSNGRKSAGVLPSSTTVDLARLVNLSEVLGSVGLQTGNYTEAVVTLDYSAAQIVYDDGSLDGVALTPQGPGGQALGQVTLILGLDPSNQLGIVRKSTSLLSLDFNLAASNIVNLAKKTVTVEPLMAASASPIDSKVVRVLGPLAGVNTSNTNFSMGIVPFESGTASAGQIQISPSTATTYEINGAPSTSTAGLTKLSSVSSGVMTEAFGTFTAFTTTNGTGTGTTSPTTVSVCTDGSTPRANSSGIMVCANGLAPTNTQSSTTPTTTVCTDGSTPTTNSSGFMVCANGLAPTSTQGTTSVCSDGSTPTTNIYGVSVCANGSAPTTTQGTNTTTSFSFSATQVLAGSSVQGSGFDRISGIVSARSGNSLAVEDGTLISNDGTNTFIPGTATINISPSTQVTQFGAASVEADGTQQISVGSLIYAFGTASTSSAGNVTLDASAGRVRIGQSTASGLVTVAGTGTLTLDLNMLGGRSPAPFDFAGTGTSASVDASASKYQVTTGSSSASLTYSTMGTPVEVSGLVTPFNQAPPDFNATSLLDSTTINATLVLDWGAGTPAPFAAYSTSQIQVDARNSSIGPRHVIQDGALSIDIVGIVSDPLIVPGGTNAVFTIGHQASGTFENFITFSAFITQLQTELNGSVLATGLTAFGPYTSGSYTLSASSVTLFLNN